MKEQGKSNFVQAATLFFLIVNICLGMLLFVPDHYDPRKILIEAEEQANPTPVSSIAEPQMLLEWRLVDRYRDGEWSVEKYREYEKYVDTNGKMVREIPTDHYNFLRYWRYP
ncbi:hypothetical protein [Ammoniphilus resinae]|uniref:Uncharacterized protein n=1 Tax=Ammoniphilus resinae TaxID=861532 RepID=A0ABS4GTL6_9BACL|nr:hypothetical protein [Ammoniphilus resinae]MBP1933619.1 hypothetical protein [Ammoniphilus resinae]